MEQETPTEEAQAKPKVNKTTAWTVLMLLRSAQPGKDPVETKRAIVGRMEARLAQLGARLDLLAAKAAQSGSEARTDQRELVADLKTKHQHARARLHELEVAGTEKWDTLKAGLETAWADLETAFANLAD